MPKDYAKRVLITSRKPKYNKRRVEFLLIPLLAIAIVGIYMAYTHKMLTPKQWLAHLQSSIHSQHATKQLAQQNALPPAETIHFDFYDELPNQKVPLPEVTNPSTSTASSKVQPHLPKTKTLQAHEASSIEASKPKIAANHYILSFGQFHKPSDASQMRISLMLADCQSEIVEFFSSGKKIYRVQLGPFTTQARAKNLQQQLFEKGVTSEVQKV